MEFYIYWDEDYNGSDRDEAREVVLNQFRKQLFVMNKPRYK